MRRGLVLKNKKRTAAAICILVILVVLLFGFWEFAFTAYTDHSMAANRSKWLCIGDSITLGETNHDISYADYVAKLSTVQLIKEGHSGYTTQQILSEFDEIDQEADVITVFIGTNDWVYDQQIGDIQDKDESTFCGRVNQIIARMKERHPDADIYVFTPLFRNMHYNPAIPFTGTVNSNGNTIEDFAKAIKSCAELNHVKCLDLYSVSGLCDKNIERLTTDGTHPNFVGQFLIALKVKEIVK